MDSSCKFDVFYKSQETSESWSNLPRLILGLASPHRKLCVSITHAFVRHQMSNDIDIVILMSEGKELVPIKRNGRTPLTKNYRGFALLELDLSLRRPEMKIQLMCAEQGLGLGTQLMKFVQNLCVDDLKRTLGIQFITLSSLAHTINFYRKLGFTHFEPKTGASAEDCKSITPYADHVAKLKFKNSTELLLDKEMSGFIRLLLKHKLTLEKHNTQEIVESTQHGYLMAFKVD